ncbi:mobile mystery protein A [Xanthobacter autotrophicus]|jgi:predicted DNA-binding mobile mystery protein A|uniref:mobile mystery protein A n=1 Tax=Xanthobacter autotrophicus TaxID=280 RepID=UPI0037297CB7
MNSNRRNLNTLARWALDQQLRPLQKMEPLIRPERGWIRAIRESIGMTTGQFAKRLGVAQPRVAALERAEANEVVTLKSLRQAAEALDCVFVYALVPKAPLEEVVKARARYVAEQQLARTDQTMRLENQGVSRARLERARDDLAEDILRNDKRLWADV